MLFGFNNCRPVALWQNLMASMTLIDTGTRIIVYTWVIRG
jgi:hypothetical protein